MTSFGDSASGQSARLARILERLDQLVDWEKRDRGGMKASIEPARDLLRRLGDPQLRLRAVHVTGTKGKGSLTSLVAHALQRAGWRSAAYCSPHVERLVERLWIAGGWVSEEGLAEALECAWSAREAALAARTPAAEATWFDLLTAASLWRAAADGVEWIALEVGIGGRLDSTNAVHGVVCAITNVELEHTALLGTTRAAIAREKSAIVKRGASVVTGLAPGCAPWSDAAGAVLEAHAARQGAAVLRPAGMPCLALDERGPALARLVLDELGRRGVLARVGPRAGEPVGPWCIDAELRAAARLPGRLERLERGGRALWLDGAHVPESLRDLLRHIRRDARCSGRASAAVFGCGRDKDAEGLLRSLGEHADTVVCTSVGSAPAASAEDLFQVARRVGLVAETAASPAEALQRAWELTPRGGWLVVTGSLHLVGALRAGALRLAEH